MAELVDVALVATDLDGTLLRSDGSVSERTAVAVDVVGASGIEVVLVTARPVRWVREIATALRCHPRVICSNGAVIVDARTGAIVVEHPIAPSSGAEIVRRLRGLLADVAFAVESGLGSGYESNYLSTWPRPDGATVATAEELVVRPVSKLVVRHGESGDHWSVIERVREVVGPLGEVSSSGPEAPIEIVAPGVSKALALEILAGDLSVAPDAVLAFGDMPNDLPMLSWAGVSVAPANAHPDVLAVVDRVTLDCDHDGVAIVLEELAVAQRRR